MEKPHKCIDSVVHFSNNDHNFEILRKAGLNKHSNDSVTTGLYEASLRGVDSHGVRLLNHYVFSENK